MISPTRNGGVRTLLYAIITALGVLAFASLGFMAKSMWDQGQQIVEISGKRALQIKGLEDDVARLHDSLESIAKSQYTKEDAARDMTELRRRLEALETPTHKDRR